MRPHLVSWQWSHYPAGHTRRRNLLIHGLTTPLFLVGTLLLLAAAASPRLGMVGLACMAVTVVAQGGGHRSERTPPEPFLGALDFITRFLAEQWITFPRFVLSGGFARAWRAP